MKQRKIKKILTHQVEVNPKKTIKTEYMLSVQR
jgi:hypothetical protein